jgi:hypothetical protein
MLPSVHTCSLALCASLGLFLTASASAQIYVDDTFSDLDRLTFPPTATNTTWVVNGGSTLTPTGAGMTWDFLNSSNRMALGYFPAVTVGDSTVTFSLTFTTGAFGSTADNLRIALVDGSPNGYRLTDGVGSSDESYTGDRGYAFMTDSNVGGGSTGDLRLRTFERATLSNNLLGTASNWVSLGSSSGATGYLDANTTYVFSVDAVYNGGVMSLTTSLMGGNLSGLSYQVQDDVSPTVAFDTFAIRFGKGDGQFDGITLNSFSVTGDLVPIPEPRMLSLFLGVAGMFLLARRRVR